MKTMTKRALNALALSAVVLGMVGASPAAAIETGQLLIKDKPISKPAIDTPVDAPPATENQLCDKPYTPPCRTDAPTTKIETGQLLDKGRPPKGQAARTKVNPVKAAGGGNPGWIIPSLSVIAVAGGVLAVTSGKDKPASPN